MTDEHLPGVCTGRVGYAVSENGIHSYSGTTPSAY